MKRLPPKVELLGLFFVVLVTAVMSWKWLTVKIAQRQANEEGTVYLASSEALAQPSTLPLAKQWCVQSQNQPVSHPLYWNGEVFVLAGWEPDTALQAYDAATGQLIWSAPTPTPILATADWWVQDGFVAAGNRSSVIVLQAKNGKLMWQKEGITNRGMAIGDGKLFVGGIDTVNAFNLATGVQVWQIPGQGRAVTNIPIYDPAGRTVVLDGTTFRVVDAATGNLIFETQPPPADDLTFGFFGEGMIYKGYLLYFDRAVDVRTGKLIHPRTIIQSLFPFVVDDTMLLNDYTGVVGVTLRDFTELWHYHSPVVEGKPLRVVGDPVALGGVVYAILGDATLRAMDLQTGRELGHWQSKEVVDRVGYETPFVAGMAVGNGQLFASWGTNEFCAFAEKP